VFDNLGPNVTTERSCSRKVILSFFTYQPCTDWDEFSLITNTIRSESHNRRFSNLRWGRLASESHSTRWIWLKLAFQHYMALECPSIRLFVCQTRYPCLNGLTYWNVLCTVQQSNVRCARCAWADRWFVLISGQFDSTLIKCKYDLQ